jgi:hypothetical protein
MTKARTLADNFAADINGITAGTGITGGGTSGTVTVTNSMATEIDAKGDLVVGTGADTFARLAVSDNGSTLVANSAAATGLSYKEDYAAGKNKIINGDFAINQRGFTSTTQSAVYTFDRYQTFTSGGTGTYSAQTFTPGTAPVAGYEAKNYLRIVTTGQSAASDGTLIDQRIEDVRTFAGQTITVSFWAKAASGTPSIAVEPAQNFGGGGSTAVNVQGIKKAITDSWARYSYTFSIPSISGKTIGDNTNRLTVRFWVSAGTDFNARLDSLGIQSNTFELWGFQVEAGSVATAFQTATGTLQGELAACQRYYYLLGNGNTAANRSICSAAAYASNDASGVVQFPVTMRTTPTLTASSGTNYYGFLRDSATDGFNSFTLGYADTTSAIIYNASQISSTAGHGGVFITQSASASVAFGAEL